MRSEQLFNALASYNWAEAETLASVQRFKGGWEGWLQVELAKHLYALLGQYHVEIERERRYPDRPIRCDFYFSYGIAGKDETYIELKCQNPMAQNPLQDIGDRFAEDLEKAISQKMLVSCLAACYGIPRAVDEKIHEAIEKAKSEAAKKRILDRNDILEHISPGYAYLNADGTLTGCRSDRLPQGNEQYFILVFCDVMVIKPLPM